LHLNAGEYGRLRDDCQVIFAHQLEREVAMVRIVVVLLARIK
jgi:hypothetical protein